MIVLYTQNLIVATALPGLNTRPAKSPLLAQLQLLLLGGGTKAVVYSKALSKIRNNSLLQKRGYVTPASGPLGRDNNNIDNSNNNSNLNDLHSNTLNINDVNNIDNIYSSPRLGEAPGRGQASIEEGIPSLDDLLKFKEEIQKIREEEFEEWLPNIENISSSMHESFPDLYPGPVDLEPGANIVNLFEIIKKIYNKIMNNDIQINDSNIDTLSNLIKNDEDSEKLSEEVKTTLENITANLNDSLSSSGMRPLGNFGDITINQLLENIQNYNFSMVLNNTELLIYPITFVPFSLLYYRLVKSYMNHCDNIKDIRRIKNERLMLEQLKIRRVSIALAVGLIIPFSSLMILKFSRTSIFDGFKFKLRNDNIEPMPPLDFASSEGLPKASGSGSGSGSGSEGPTKSQILTLFLLNKGPLRLASQQRAPALLAECPPKDFSFLMQRKVLRTGRGIGKGVVPDGLLASLAFRRGGNPKGGSLARGGGGEQPSLFKKENNNKSCSFPRLSEFPRLRNHTGPTGEGGSNNNLKRKNNKFKLLIVIILLLTAAIVLFYFNKLSWLFNTITLNIIIFLYFVFFLISFFIYLFGFFILKFKENINIDLSFIKISYIRSLIESFIIIKNSNDKLAIDILQKTINRHLIMYIFVLILIFVLFVFNKTPPPPQSKVSILIRALREAPLI